MLVHFEMVLMQVNRLFHDRCILLALLQFIAVLDERFEGFDDSVLWCHSVTSLGPPVRPNPQGRQGPTRHRAIDLRTHRRVAVRVPARRQVPPRTC